MFLEDLPITNKKDDVLERGLFVKQLSSSINNWDNDKSLVISLNGKWGTGKTSILNLVKNELEKNDKLTLLEFNPWIFSKQDLTKHFFSQIANELYSRKEATLARKLKKFSSALEFGNIDSLLDKVVKRGTLILMLFGLSVSQLINADELLWIKYFLGILFLILLLIEIVSIVFGQLADLIAHFKPNQPIQAIKNEIGEYIKTNNKRLVIFLDDLDRLEAIEIKEIIKLVKVNSDFPKTIFVLSYDKKVVLDALSTGGWFESQSYLEKIVQVGFDIPIPNHEKVIKLLTTGIDKIINKIDISRNFDQEYWTNIFHAGLMDLFVNIRDVKRFLNNFRFNFALFTESKVLNVNITDLIALEAIRLKHPGFYEYIRDHKTLFTESRSNSRDEITEKKKTEILDAMKEHSAESLKEVISRLFPQIGGILGKINYESEWQKIWAKNLRVCSSEYFDQYFRLLPGGGQDQVTQAEIIGLMRLTSNKAKLRSFLLKMKKKKRLAQLLFRFENHIDDKLINEKSKQDNLIEALFNISEYEESGDPLALEPNILDSTFRIAYQFLEMDDKNNRHKRLGAIVQKVLGWSTPLHFATILEDRNNPSKQIIETIKLKKIQHLAIRNIGNVNVKDLHKSHEFVSLLYRLRDLKKTKELNEILKIYQKRENIINFVKSFKSETRSRSMGDHYNDIKTTINMESIAKFLDIHKVMKLIKTVPRSSQNKEIIDIFESSYRNYIHKKKKKKK